MAFKMKNIKILNDARVDNQKKEFLRNEIVIKNSSTVMTNKFIVPKDKDLKK